MSELQAGITIVMAAYNVEDFIDETLGSLARQDFTDFKLVVVDDGSHDDTARRVRAYADRLDVDLCSIPNGGVSNARNTGLARVVTDCVLFLDGDDLLRPDAIGMFHSAMRQHPDWVGCTANHVKFKHQLPSMSSGGVGDGFDLRENFVADILRRNYVVNGGAFCMRTEAARAAGGFDTALELGEDHEFWLRVGMEGPVGHSDTFFPLAYRVRESGANYRLRAKDAGASIERMFKNPRLVEFLSEQEISQLRKYSDAERHWTDVRISLSSRQFLSAALGALTGILRHPIYLGTFVGAMKRKRSRRLAAR